MNSREKYFELQRQLLEVEIEIKKEDFLNEDYYWTLEDDQISITKVRYTSSNQINQCILSKEEKEIYWKNYEKLYREANK